MATLMAVGGASPADARTSSASRSRADAHLAPGRAAMVPAAARPTGKSKPAVVPAALKPERPAEPPQPTGPLQIVVSIGSQRVTVFDGTGAAVASARISSGRPGYETPRGIFSIIQKNKDHRSNLYDDAPMPYMQRITWSGVALHEGKLPGYPASHGCIRMPGDFARRLFAMTRMGTRVVVTGSELQPVRFQHAALFEPAPKPVDDLIAAPMTPDIGVPAGLPAAIAAEDAGLSAAAPDQDRTIGEHRVATIGTALRPAAKPPVDDPRAGPIAVLISRKDGKMHVRQAFKPLFSVPVTIADPARPLGTHVLTATQLVHNGTAMQWTALTVVGDGPRVAAAFATAADAGGKGRGRNGKAVPVAVAPPPAPGPMTAAAALDRIKIPYPARDRISRLLSTGSSIIVTDNGASSETGKGTDFIISTR